MKRETGAGRLFVILARSYPSWAGGPHELGNCFHKASTRIGDTIEPAGFQVESRIRDGETWSEYRFANTETAARATLQVVSWASGIPLAELEADAKHRQAALPLGGA